MNDMSAKKGYKILIFCIITILYFFSLYTYVSNLPTYITSLGGSYKMVGIITGSYGLAQLICRVPFGIISDKMRNRKLFINIGLVCAMLTGLGGYLFSSVGMLLILRTLSGVAVSTWVIFTVLFSSYYKENELPKAIGIINSMNMIGQVLGTFMGGIIVEKYNMSFSFLVAAFVAFIALILNLFIPKEKLVVVNKPKKINLSFLRNKKFVSICFLAAIIQFMTFATVFGFNPIVAKRLGAGDFQLGLLATISFFTAIISSLISGTYYIKKFKVKNVLMIGICVQAMCCMLTPFMPNLYILYILESISGFVRGLTFSTLMGLSIEDINEHERATAMGVFQAVYGFGMFIGPVIVGFISQTFGISTGFLIIGIASIISSALLSRGYCHGDGVRLLKKSQV